MKKAIFILFIFSGLYAQCDNYNQSQCDSDNTCNWVSDIETESCGSLYTAQSCGQAEGCYWSCQGGWYLGNCYGTYGCGGGSYQVDNGYCEAIQEPEPPACSELTELGCNHPEYGSGCEWISDIETESCLPLNESHCDDTNGCNWVSDIDSGWCGNLSNSSSCYQMGCSWSCTLYYLGNCYGYACGGGSYYEDNSYCGGTAEVDYGYCTEQYMLGDLDSDGYVNIIDVVELVQIVLNSQYDAAGDMNDDGSTNVVDIVSLVDIILGE